MSDDKKGKKPKEDNPDEEKLKVTVVDGGVEIIHERKVERPTNYCETLMHCIKGNIGTGTFAIGDAFKNAGLIIAIPGMVIICLVSLHLQHVLLKVALKLKDKFDLECPPEYAATFYYTFATSSNLKMRKYAHTIRRMINIFLCLTQWGFNCIHVVFVATNFKKILEYFDVYIDIHIVMLFFFVPIWASCMVLNLKYLAPISGVANAIYIIGLVMIMYFLCQDIPPLSRLPLITKHWDKFPLYFGTVICTFEGIALVLPLNREMKEPRLFGLWYGVLNVGTFIVFLILFGIGFLSFARYGEDVLGSVTSNLPNHIVAVLSQVMLTFAVTFTFCLQFYIPIKITWAPIMRKYNFKHPVFFELIYRTIICIIIFILAEVIPYLNLFIALIGAVGSTALALIFPPLLEMTDNLEEVKKYKFSYVKNVCIILVGIVEMIVGTYYSVVAIVEQVRKDIGK